MTNIKTVKEIRQALKNNCFAVYAIIPGHSGAQRVFDARIRSGCSFIKISFGWTDLSDSITVYTQ